ncbi:hypothetical protein CDV31_012295 [Fusarium ambrosium]|uniref:Uncharacterized protein n=1 Tax=Fusarium ambrosium TaxID=131363 RepID=A0A428TAU6_9HYPO|nr:hypothetical protein CDV31_012295 [Fusarium ambrosium]
MVGTRPRHPQVRALTHNCAWDLDDSRIIEPNEGDWVTETIGYFPKATYLSLASTSCADVIALFFNQPPSWGSPSVQRLLDTTTRFYGIWFRFPRWGKDKIPIGHVRRRKTLL